MNEVPENESTAQPSSVFGSSRWIWSGDERKFQFLLLRRGVQLDESVPHIDITIYASYHYELYINGIYVDRGPVHGDPAWCVYDQLVYKNETDSRQFEIVILANHSFGTYLHYLTDAPAGIIANFTMGETVIGTDSSWHCRELECWSEDVEPKNWALGYCEDYDARLEPVGMDRMQFDTLDDSWVKATELPETAAIWSGFTPRMTPHLVLAEVRPQSFTAFSAGSKGESRVFDISAHHDTEQLEPKGVRSTAYSSEALLIAQRSQNANAFTFDLGVEYAGFYGFEADAPAGTVIEVSGAELLQPGEDRPWVFRKNSCYSARFVCASGKRRYRTFFWSGLRYLHVVIRSSADGAHDAHESDAKLLDVYCIERAANSRHVERPKLTPRFNEIYDICARTLRIAGQEFHSDCPTREQAAAWLDGLISTPAALVLYNEPGYIQWYFEAFINATIDEFGLFNGRYPGTIGRWIDMCLHPLITHAWYRRNTGVSFSPGRMVEKALLLKRWYDGETDDRGIINFDFKAYFDRGLRTFTDHPGLSMHDAEHVGIDRDGASCALNCYFLMFLDELAILAKEAGRAQDAEETGKQADSLRNVIIEVFFDGNVFHDCETLRFDTESDRLSEGTSWQTNSIAVAAGILEAPRARKVMERMVEGYETLCRCTPGLSYFFIRALDMAGMKETIEWYIEKEWGSMCGKGANTCWETFLGNEKDSLCHPWGVAPILYFHDAL